MAALKISRKHCLWRHQTYDIPSWGQIKTFTNEIKNLISQQGMPQSAENLLIAMCRWPAHRPAQAELTNLPNPPFFAGHKIDGEKTDRSYQPMTPPTCPLPGTLTPWGVGKTN